MKKILTLLLALLIITGCSAQKQEQAQKQVDSNETVLEIPSFSIEICGQEITDKDLASYELVSFEVKLVNSKGTEKEYKFTGYRITDVLEACNLNMNEGQIVATATDGYETIYKDNIILDTTLIALFRNDETFAEGPWLAPCSSSTNGDYLKNVSIINIAVN